MLWMCRAMLNLLKPSNEISFRCHEQDSFRPDISRRTKRTERTGLKCLSTSGGSLTHFYNRDTHTHTYTEKETTQRQRRPEGHSGRQWKIWHPISVSRTLTIMADNMAQLTLKSDCHTSRQLTKVSLNAKTKKPLAHIQRKKSWQKIICLGFLG